MEWLADPLTFITIKLALMLIGGFIIGFYFGMLYVQDSSQE